MPLNVKFSPSYQPVGTERVSGRSPTGRLAVSRATHGKNPSSRIETSGQSSHCVILGVRPTYLRDRRTCRQFAQSGPLAA